MNFTEITSNNNWFQQHPEKIAGVEFTTTSIFFPIQVKGTKEDVLRVTGVSEKENNLKASAKDLSYEDWKIESKKWDDFTDELSKKVNSVSIKGEMGLSKRTPEFIKAKKEYDIGFKKYQNFNKSTPKGFAKRRFNEKIEKANQNHKSKRIRIAKAKAKAIKIKLLLNESL